MASNKLGQVKENSAMPAITVNGRNKSILLKSWKLLSKAARCFIEELEIVFLYIWRCILTFWSGLFYTREKQSVHKWIQSCISNAPEDFNESWQDGVVFCSLLESLFPGCCPRPDLLDRSHGKKNLTKALEIAQKMSGIVPNVTAEDIGNDKSPDSEKKLVSLLRQLKKKTESKTKIILDSEKFDNNISLICSSEVQPCFAKGIGLVIGFVGRVARFTLFFDLSCDLDIVLEIRGPENTVCCERITNRSPKRKKSSVKLTQRPRLSRIGRSISLNGGFDVEPVETAPQNVEQIRLEYEIQAHKITVGYIPMKIGQHKVTILSHGQHISGSPFTVGVEDAFEKMKDSNVVRLSPPLCLADATESFCSKRNSKARKQSVRFKESDADSKQCCKVKKRKTLRYIVNVGGKEVVVDADSSDMLAPALLKLDCEIDNSFLTSRRNSWGFTGDVERKKSIVRQFRVDTGNADSNILQRRSSLNFSSNKDVKKLSCSQGSQEFIDDFSGLMTVAEGTDSALLVDERISDLDTDENWAEEISENKLSHSDIDQENLCAGCGSFQEPSTSRFQKLSLSCSNTGSNLQKKNPTNNYNGNNFPEKQNSCWIPKSNCQEFTTVAFEKHGNEALPLSKLFNEIYVPYEESKTYDNLLNIFEANELIQSTDSLRFGETSDINIDSKHFVNNNSQAEYSSQQTSTLVKNEEYLINEIEPLEKEHGISKIFKSTAFVCSRRIFPLQRHTKPSISGSTKKSRKYKKIKRSTVDKTLLSKKCTIPRRRRIDSKHVLIPNLSSKINCRTNKSSKISRAHILETSIKSRRRAHQCAARNDAKANQICQKWKDANSKQSNFIRIPSGVSGNEKKGAREDDNSGSETDTLRFSSTRFSQEQDTPMISEIAHVPKRLSRQSAIEMEHSHSGTNSSITNVQNIQKPRFTFQPNKWRGLSIFEMSCSPSVKELVTELKSRFSLACPSKENNLYSHNLNFPPLAVNVDRKPVKTRIRQWETTSSLPSSIHKSKDSFDRNPDKYKLSIISDVHTKTVFWENIYKRRLSVSRIANNEGKRKFSVGSGAAVEREKNMPLTGHRPSQTKDKKEVSESCLKTEMLPEHVRSYNQTTREHDKPVSTNLLMPKFGRRYSDPGPIVNRREGKFCHTPKYFKLGGNSLSRTNSESTLDVRSSPAAYPSSVDGDRESYRDGYIDDEILDYAAMFLDHYDAHLLFDRRCDSRPNADECKVFGSGIHYGHVATKNHFQVLTKGAGKGNLSVSMLGSSNHDVTHVSVTYIRKDIYVVTYQVLEPGYYLISVRWSDIAVPGSPFICKVTY